MKIALIHDHLAQDGGAEKVVQAFAELWPDAPIYVLVHNPEQANAFFRTRDIRTSFLQRMPFGVKKYQWYLPMMPTATESFDLSEFDVVISSTSMFAKGVITRPGTLHISYCHTPTRFLWSDTHSYVAELGVSAPLKKIIPLFLSYIRLWDRIAAERVDKYIANSVTVQKRITKYYHQDSTIIHPPVVADRFGIAKPEERKEYFLAGGRLVPYKRFDLLVEAFNKVGKPLKIFGDGPVREELQRMAHPNIEFIGRVTDEQLQTLYAECAAFLNPQEEDFGITMIEAMAAGRPVIAYNKGGATEIVKPGTGVLVEYQTWEDFADAVMTFDPQAYDPEAIRAHALTFDVTQFKTTIQTFVENAWKEFQRNS